MSVHAGLNCLSLLTWGTEDQKQRYLVPQAQGKKIAGYGLTEPGAGSDARAIQTTAVKKGDRVRPQRREELDFAGRRRRQLPRHRLDRSRRRRSSAIPSGISAFIVERTFKGFSSGPMKEKWGILAGNTGWFKMDDVEVPEENLLGPARRRLQDRDVRARSGALHGGGRRHRADPRVPRREREVREGAADLRRRDRPAPAREGNDRADGVRLSGGAAAVAALGLDEERGPAQHARDRAGEVVRHRRVGARRGRRRADSRRQRLLRRISGRAVLPELQGRGHLRRHARNPQADAGRLPARLPHGPADALRAAAVPG